MNFNAVTLEDCIDNYEKKGRTAVIADGKLLCFQQDLQIAAASEADLKILPRFRTPIPIAKYKEGSPCHGMSRKNM